MSSSSDRPQPSSRPAADLVREALARLESGFRDVTLLALADWMGTGLPAPELHSVVAGLQRPSWGHWNGLLAALRALRRDLLRRAGPAERRRLESARLLRRIHEALGARPPEALLAELHPAARLAQFRLPARPTLADVLALPIALRNRAVHDRPTGPEWWEQAAAGLRALEDWLEESRPFREVLAEASWPEPWFLGDGEARWTFHGLTRDYSAIYVDRRGRSRQDRERGGEVLQALQALLGRARAQEQDFRRLLAELAPEEIRGVLLGDFLLGRPAGRGGHATVHRARQLSTGRRVAVKVLRGDVPEQVRQRFQQEATWATLFGHQPNIVQVLACGEDPWRLPRNVDLEGEAWFRDFQRGPAVLTWLAMEWVDGPDLEEVFQGRQAAAPDVRQLAGWFADAAGALAAVHACGLIHRDLKPGNLMVTREGVLKVMDFGIARTQAEDRELRTLTGQEPGTPAYMSPEQLRAHDPDCEVGPASDVYSLCATFYELFTGHRLFDHDRTSLAEVRRRKLAGERPVRPGRLVPDLPWEIDTILMGGLEPEPADRYPNMQALEQDLRRFLADEPIAYRRPTTWRRLRLAWRRNRAVYRTAAVFALLLAGMGWRYLADVTAERDRALARTEQVLLLADRENLARLEEQARDLVPARPEKAAAMEAWLAEAGRLRARLPVHASVLAELRARAEPGDGGELHFADARDGWWFRTEQALVTDLEAFFGPGQGTAARVRSRLAWARTVAERTVTSAEAARLWAEARAAIGDRRRCPAYGGLDLPPQVGLLPLGQDPDSGLWEFVHLQSGSPPARGPDGRLRLEPGNGIVLVLLPGGEFRMGSSPDPESPNHFPGAVPREGPVHRVSLAPFFLAKHELTRAQWDRLTRDDPYYEALTLEQVPGYEADPLHPVIGVSWEEARRLCAAVDLTLPTEAQWEYAARAGTSWPWYCGPAKEGLDACVNLADASAMSVGDTGSWLGLDPELEDGYALLAPVGSLRANAFGLHDMLGNVWEWCADSFGAYTLPVRPGTGERMGGDPRTRVRRGGSFRNGPQHARCGARPVPTAGGGGFSDGLRPARRVELVTFGDQTRVRR